MGFARLYLLHEILLNLSVLLISLREKCIHCRQLSVWPLICIRTKNISLQGTIQLLSIFLLLILEMCSLFLRRYSLLFRHGFVVKRFGILLWELSSFLNGQFGLLLPNGPWTVFLQQLHVNLEIALLLEVLLIWFGQFYLVIFVCFLFFKIKPISNAWERPLFKIQLVLL